MTSLQKFGWNGVIWQKSLFWIINFQRDLNIIDKHNEVGVGLLIRSSTFVVIQIKVVERMWWHVIKQNKLDQKYWLGGLHKQGKVFLFCFVICSDAIFLSFIAHLDGVFNKTEVIRMSLSLRQTSKNMWYSSDVRLIFLKYVPHWRSLLLWIQVTWESWFLFVIRIISTTRKIPSKKLIRLKMIRFYLVGYQSLNQAWCRNIQILWKWSILKYYFINLKSFVSNWKYRWLSPTYFCFLQKIRWNWMEMETQIWFKVFILCKV